MRLGQIQGMQMPIQPQELRGNKIVFTSSQACVRIIHHSVREAMPPKINLHQKREFRVYSNFFSHALMVGSLFLALITAVSALNTKTRRDLDNISALLAKDLNHEKCKEIDCWDRTQRIYAILKEASRIPADAINFK
jgi:hypothetical protein